ncbi:MAG: cell envelope integrity protein TolA [Coxiellaceae bacterium]|nr:MAG: cell envelope integrity protein TolA [Coxiellaceae bacterium]
MVRSSGNSALDNSAVSAVFKTSPLPVPTDAELFDKFRELRLTVRPENIVGG